MVNTEVGPKHDLSFLLQQSIGGARSTQVTEAQIADILPSIHQEQVKRLLPEISPLLLKLLSSPRDTGEWMETAENLCTLLEKFYNHLIGYAQEQAKLTGATGEFIKMVSELNKIKPTPTSLSENLIQLRLRMKHHQNEPENCLQFPSEVSPLLLRSYVLLETLRALLKPTAEIIYTPFPRRIVVRVQGKPQSGMLVRGSFSFANGQAKSFFEKTVLLDQKGRANVGFPMPEKAESYSLEHPSLLEN
jgi:hypothetical protein